MLLSLDRARTVYAVFIGSSKHIYLTVALLPLFLRATAVFQRRMARTHQDITFPGKYEYELLRLGCR